MKRHPVLVEIGVILGAAVAVGTVVHILRPDKGKKIDFVAGKLSYINPFTPDYTRFQDKRKPETPPAQPPASPAPISPAAATKAGASQTGPAGVVQAPPTGAAAPSTGAAGKTSEKTSEKTEDKAPEKGAPVQISQAIREILIDEAKAEFDAGTTFLDARRMSEYQQGHVPRAISLSIYEPGLEQKIENCAKNDAPTDVPVVVYCQTPNCGDSKELAKSLETYGYKDIRVMQGGFPEWEKKKYPIEKSAGEGSDPASGAGEEAKR